MEIYGVQCVKPVGRLVWISAEEAAKRPPGGACLKRPRPDLAKEFWPIVWQIGFARFNPELLKQEHWQKFEYCFLPDTLREAPLGKSLVLGEQHHWPVLDRETPKPAPKRRKGLAAWIRSCLHRSDAE